MQGTGAFPPPAVLQLRPFIPEVEKRSDSGECLIMSAYVRHRRTLPAAGSQERPIGDHPGRPVFRRNFSYFQRDPICRWISSSERLPKWGIVFNPGPVPASRLFFS